MQPSAADRPMDPYQSGSVVPTEDRTWMVLAHLSAPIAAVLSAGSLSILGPLVIWLIGKNRSPWIREAAAGAFNFNLTFWVLYVVGWILFFTLIGIPFALLLWGIIFVVSLFAHLIGALRASRGEAFTYPFQIRVLS